MNEIKKISEGKYVTSCEDFIYYSDIAGKLSSLKYKVESWIEDYGQDAIISISYSEDTYEFDGMTVSYSEDTYEFDGMTVKYCRPSKKSEINRYERTERLEKLEEEKKLKRLAKKSR